LVCQSIFQEVDDFIGDSNLLLPQDFRQTVLEDLGVELPGLTIWAVGFTVLKELVVAVRKLGVGHGPEELQRAL